MEIWLRQDGAEYGPYSLEDVTNFIKNGETSLDDEAWFEGSEDYQLVRDIPSIQVPFKKAPANDKRKTGLSDLGKRIPKQNSSLHSLSDIFEIPEKRSGEQPATNRQKDWIRNFFVKLPVNLRSWRNIDLGPVNRLGERQATHLIKKIENLKSMKENREHSVNFTPHYINLLVLILGTVLILVLIKIALALVPIAILAVLSFVGYRIWKAFSEDKG